MMSHERKRQCTNRCKTNEILRGSQLAKSSQGSTIVWTRDCNLIRVFGRRFFSKWSAICHLETFELERKTVFELRLRKPMHLMSDGTNQGSNVPTYICGVCWTKCTKSFSEENSAVSPYHDNLNCPFCCPWVYVERVDSTSELPWIDIVSNFL